MGATRTEIDLLIELMDVKIAILRRRIKGEQPTSEVVRELKLEQVLRDAADQHDIDDL